MIYLIYQITFIFLTQIYYNMNFITSTISSQGFPGTLRSIFADCFWRTLFCSTHKKMHIAEYVCKTCLKELGILLNCWENFKKFLAACNSSQNTALPQFFFEDFWQLHFKNINFPAKTKRCLLCWLLWIRN